MRPGWLVTALTLLALASGCALKPAPTSETVLAEALPPGTHIPPQWSADPARSADVGNGWVKDFADPALEALIAEAIAHNPDLRQAASRVAVAQQAVVLAGAQLQPQAGAALGARSTVDNGAGGAFNSNQVFASVAWELDVWGRLRAQQAAAVAGADAAELDYAFARQSLAALTAKAWIVTIESRQMLALADQAVTVYGELLRLVKVRREAGRVGDMDVAEVAARQQEAQAAQERARGAYAQARRALEVLIGRYPAAQIEVAAALPVLAPAPEAGLPAALLQRRPDLLAAERAVLAAFREQEAAELALLPGFSIGLSGGRLADGLLALLKLNPWLATATIGMSIPIYTGGALQAQVVIATARQAGTVANYGSVALTAFREAEDALAAERYLSVQLPYMQGALKERTDTVRIADIQYRAGRIDLLWVSNLQADQIATAQQLIQLQTTQRINRIKLDLALGRGYDASPASRVSTAF